MNLEYYTEIFPEGYKFSEDMNLLTKGGFFFSEWAEDKVHKNGCPKFNLLSTHGIASFSRLKPFDDFLLPPGICGIKGFCFVFCLPLQPDLLAHSFPSEIPFHLLELEVCTSPSLHVKFYAFCLNDFHPHICLINCFFFL
uniref:Uncharacterized protein n=1 Tax=Pipistrellus kuhlii TaxID=59472 RepID=A0A7J8A7D3_PIPKU|nr:hypothetical protein mPipKuh1_008852 [Pipistrellus kuhlii]